MTSDAFCRPEPCMITRIQEHINNMDQKWGINTDSRHKYYYLLNLPLDLEVLSSEKQRTKEVIKGIDSEFCSILLYEDPSYGVTQINMRVHIILIWVHIIYWFEWSFFGPKKDQAEVLNDYAWPLWPGSSKHTTENSVFMILCWNWLAWKRSLQAETKNKCKWRQICTKLQFISLVIVLLYHWKRIVNRRRWQQSERQWRWLGWGKSDGKTGNHPGRPKGNSNTVTNLSFPLQMYSRPQGASCSPMSRQ